MKKQYNALEIEAVFIELTDIIATSSPFDSEEQPFSRPDSQSF